MSLHPSTNEGSLGTCQTAVGPLAHDGYSALAEAPSLRKKHGAQGRKTLQGVKLSRLYTMTVSPIVITGRQNKRMSDGLKGIVDRYKALGQRTGCECMLDHHFRSRQRELQMKGPLH